MTRSIAKTMQDPTPTTTATQRLSGEFTTSGMIAATTIGRFQRARRRPRARS